MKKFHNKRVGTDVLLLDGQNVAKDETRIRDLKQYGTDLVVFWTRPDTASRPVSRTPLGSASVSSINSKSRARIGPSPAIKTESSKPAPSASLPVSFEPMFMHQD